MMFAFISLFWDTFLFKYGLVSILCKNFMFSFILMVFYPLCFIGERIFRIVI